MIQCATLLLKQIRNTWYHPEKSSFCMTDMLCLTRQVIVLQLSILHNCNKKLLVTRKWSYINIVCQNKTHSIIKLPNLFIYYFVKSNTMLIRINEPDIWGSYVVHQPFNGLSNESNFHTFKIQARVAKRCGRS